MGQGRETPHSDFMCANSPFSRAASGGLGALRLGKDPHPQPRQSEGLGRICALLLLGSQSADRETGCKACFQENSCSGDLEVQNPNPQTSGSHLYRPFSGTILLGHHVWWVRQIAPLAQFMGEGSDVSQVTLRDTCTATQMNGMTIGTEEAP